MALFYYQALERNGRKTKGMIEADSARHARQLLRGKELIPVHIEARMNTSSPALPSRRTGCPFLVGLWLAMRNGLSAASMNAGDGAPGWRWLRSCSAPSSMSRIYRFR